MVSSIPQGCPIRLTGILLGCFYHRHQLRMVIGVCNHLGCGDEEPGPTRYFRLQGGDHGLGIVPNKHFTPALHQPGILVR